MSAQQRREKSRYDSSEDDDDDLPQLVDDAEGEEDDEYLRNARRFAAGEIDFSQYMQAAAAGAAAAAAAAPFSAYPAEGLVSDDDDDTDSDHDESQSLPGLLSDDEGPSPYGSSSTRHPAAGSRAQPPRQAAAGSSSRAQLEETADRYGITVKELLALGGGRAADKPKPAAPKKAKKRPERPYVPQKKVEYETFESEAIREMQRKEEE